MAHEPARVLDQSFTEQNLLAQSMLCRQRTASQGLLLSAGHRRRVFLLEPDHGSPTRVAAIEAV